MSVEAMTWAFQQDLPSTEKFVLVAHANYADADGYGFAGQKRLARMCGASERTVRRAIASLEAAGYLRREGRRRQDGSFTSDEYWLDLARPTPLISTRRTAPKPSEPSGQTGRRQDLHPSVINDPTSGHIDRRPETTTPAAIYDTSSGQPDRAIEPSVLEPSEEPSEEPPAARASRPPDPMTDDETRFNAFWAVYPRRDERKRAALAFQRALKRAPFDVVFEAARRYRDDPNRVDGQYTKQAPTWLNGDCWNDPPLPARHAPPGRESSFDRVVNQTRQAALDLQELERERAGSPQAALPLGA